MKKTTVFSVMATVLFLFTFSIPAFSADMMASCTPPGNINRGCEGVQSMSTPFDYENMSDFCEQSQGWGNHRALFPVCDCFNVASGDVLDIYIDILVNGQTGDNGVYWAQNVSSVGVSLGTYASMADACNDSNNYNGVFAGQYRYEKTDGSEGDIYPADSVIRFGPAPNQQAGSHGYVVTEQDDAENRSVFAIDIPQMQVDPAIVWGGDVVSVRVCLIKGYDEGSPVSCCLDLVVGTLCCPPDPVVFTFPYFQSGNDWWAGIVINNNSDVDGDAVLNIYEQDGDQSMVTISVPAKGAYIQNNFSLFASALPTAGSGTLGDSDYFINASCDFDGNGFAFQGNDAIGEAFGIKITKDRQQFTFPYFTPGNNPDWPGIFTIYNNSGVSGNATLMIYENDGDVGNLAVTIPAKGLYVDSITNICAGATGSATLGDQRGFINVSCDFYGNGFGMIQNPTKGQCMSVDTISDESTPVPESPRGDFNYNGKLDVGDSIGILQTVTGIRN